MDSFSVPVQTWNETVCQFHLQFEAVSQFQFQVETVFFTGNVSSYFIFENFLNFGQEKKQCKTVSVWNSNKLKLKLSKNSKFCSILILLPKSYGPKLFQSRQFTVIWNLNDLPFARAVWKLSLLLKCFVTLFSNHA